MAKEDGQTEPGGQVFYDEDTAYDFVERHVWPDGPVCPHCMSNERIGRLNGTSTRVHTYKCYACRKPFTVKVGTILQDSKVPLHKWLQAMVLWRGARKRVNAGQVSNALGVTFKTAAAMLSRIREAACSPCAPDRSKSGKRRTPDS